MDTGMGSWVHACSRLGMYMYVPICAYVCVNVCVCVNPLSVRLLFVYPFVL